MIKFRKKGIIGYTLVVLIAFLIIAVVMFRLQDVILALLRGIGEDQTCVWSSILQSSAKIGGVTTSNFDCPAKIVTIGLKDDRKENVVGIDKPISRLLKEKLLKWNYNSAYLENNYKEYRANEIVANEMKSCWNKLGRGELNLFDDWFTGLKFTKSQGWYDKSKQLLTGQVEFQGAPRVCVICSKVQFKDEVANIKPAEGSPLDQGSLYQWTLRHPVNEASPKPVSYYEFLKDDVYSSDFWIKNSPKFRYTTKETYAVLFVRVNVFYLWSLASDVGNYLGIINNNYAPIDTVYLVPFSKINDECDLLMN